MWYIQEGDVVHWRGWCGTLKRVVWYFEEGGVVCIWSIYWSGWQRLVWFGQHFLIVFLPGHCSRAACSLSFFTTRHPLATPSDFRRHYDVFFTIHCRLVIHTSRHNTYSRLYEYYCSSLCSEWFVRFSFFSWLADVWIWLDCETACSAGICFFEEGNVVLWRG